MQLKFQLNYKWINYKFAQFSNEKCDVGVNLCPFRLILKKMAILYCSHGISKTSYFSSKHLEVIKNLLTDFVVRLLVLLLPKTWPHFNNILKVDKTKEL